MYPITNKKQTNWIFCTKEHGGLYCVWRAVICQLSAVFCRWRAVSCQGVRCARPTGRQCGGGAGVHRGGAHHGERSGLSGASSSPSAAHTPELVSIALPSALITFDWKKRSGNKKKLTTTSFFSRFLTVVQLALTFSRS